MADRGYSESDFSFAEMQREVDMRLRLKHPEKYCEKVCAKMAYYMQKVHNYDIMRMDVDFFKDENGKIWMYYVRDIVVKNNDTTVKVEKLTKLK